MVGYIMKYGSIDFQDVKTVGALYNMRILHINGLDDARFQIFLLTV